MKQINNAKLVWCSVLGVGLTAVMSGSIALGGYVETFDTEAVADTWWAYEAGGVYYPDWSGGADPYIYTSFNTEGGAWLYADATSSGGNMVGDFTAASIGGLRVEAYCDDPEYLDWVDVYLVSDYDNTYYMLDFTLPDDSWYRLTALFDDPDWWNSTTNSFERPSAAALSQVSEVGVHAWGIDGLTQMTWINIDTFTLLSSMPGDANYDGDVNEADAAIVAANWLGTGGWGEGNFNDDEIIDDKDATIMAANWGNSTNVAVPEPSTLVGLLGLCIAGFLASARRRQSREH